MQRDGASYIASGLVGPFAPPCQLRMFQFAELISIDTLVFARPCSDLCTACTIQYTFLAVHPPCHRIVTLVALAFDGAILHPAF